MAVDQMFISEGHYFSYRDGWICVYKPALLMQ